MVFSSAVFLFCFLPLVYLLSRLPLGRRWQNALLAGASLVFYAFGNLHYVPLFLLSILVNFLTGLLLGGGVGCTACYVLPGYQVKPTRYERHLRIRPISQ